MTSTVRILCMAMALGAAGAGAETDLAVGEARLVRDFVPGEESSISANIVLVDGVAVTQAFDGKVVRWVRSDGTSAGTEFGPATGGPRVEMELYPLSRSVIGKDLPGKAFRSYEPGAGKTHTFAGPGLIPIEVPIASPVLPYGDRLTFFRQVPAPWPDFRFSLKSVTAQGMESGVLEEMGIQVIVGPRVSAITPSGVFLVDAGRVVRTDGTPEGTRQVLSTSIVSAVTHAGGHDLAFSGDVIYRLGATEEDTTVAMRLGSEWIVSDPDPVAAGRAGRMMVNAYRSGDSAIAAVGIGSGIEELVPLEVGLNRIVFRPTEDRAFAFLEYPDNVHLWATAGTPQATRMIGIVERGPGARLVGADAAIGDVLLFTERGPDGFDRIWATRGRTGDLRELAAFPAGSQPASFCAVGDQVLFTADHPLTGRELFAIPLSVVQGEPLQIGDDNGDRVTDAADALAVAEAAEVVIDAAR